jgi:hypothetical protein
MSQVKTNGRQSKYNGYQGHKYGPSTNQFKTFQPEYIAQRRNNAQPDTGSDQKNVIGDHHLPWDIGVKFQYLHAANQRHQQGIAAEKNHGNQEAYPYVEAG